MIRARAILRCGFATTAAIAAVVAVAPAGALATSGTSTLFPHGPAADSLRAEGVEITPLRPATGSGRRIALPIRSGLAGSSTIMFVHGGGISLTPRRGRALRLRKLRLVLGRRPRLSAKLGGRELDVFAVLGRGNRKVDAAAGTASLDNLRLRLTPAGARAIDERLAVEVEAGIFGKLSSRAAGLTAPDSPPEGSDVAQKASSCALPSGAGPAPEDPLPVAMRPPGAADITAATVDWHVRESFVRYIASGEGASVSGGATADPPVLLPGASAALSYDFHFPFANGWLDSGANPADPADDTAAIYFGGTVRFLYSGHGIDLATSSPEIEIAGAASRTIFAIAEKGAAPTRQVLVNLDLSRAAAISVSGNTHTYDGVPGAIPAGTASSTFGGFYAPGTEFGCFNITYTTS